MTTNGRGQTPEELAERALARIIHVGEGSHPAIIEQAKAFRNNIHAVLVDYLQQAQVSERTNIIAALDRSGNTDISNIIRSL